jgi:orotate phosphoribosyltransferase-like protein
MTSLKKYILVAVVIVVALVAFMAYKEYNRKPADVSSLTAQETIDATKLIAAYENDEPSANKLYLGKVLLVNGEIAAIENQQDTLVNILLGGQDNMHKVSCLLDKEQTKYIKKYNVKNNIAIKGICTGFLADVEMNRCVFVDENK